MDREALRAWLDDGLSLEQIGAIVGRHPSTIAYWLKKFALVANGRSKYAPRGGVSRDELARLVDAGETLDTIATELGVSVPTIRYWIVRHDLPRPHVQRRQAIERALDEGRRTMLRDCGRHGWTVFVIENSGRTRCRRCGMERVAAWRRRAKARLVGRSWRSLPALRLSPLPGCSAISPPRSVEEVLCALAARRYPVDGGASG